MITQKRLHELFEYREDGNLIRKINVSSNARKGDIIGTIHNRGYMTVLVDQKSYLVHRLIFLYYHGYLTEGLQIDHIDGNRQNNRIENLREVTGSQNNMNSKIRSNNTSGVKGVWWSKEKRKWRSMVKVNHKEIFLGYYTSLEEAAAVVKEAREKYHGEYARHE
jgi:hypothetical protein